MSACARKCSISNELTLQVLNGLFVGLSLALVAAGLALVFGVLRIMNFAQGELVMLGAYVLVFVNDLTHSFGLAVVAAVVSVAVLGGITLFVLLRPLQGRHPALPMLATLGLSLILRQLAATFFGGFVRTVNQPVTLAAPVVGVQYPLYDLLIALVSALALAAVYAFLRKHAFGLWLRAAVDNARMAAALGVPLQRVYLVAFVLSAGLSALAGAMLAPVVAVYPGLGQDIAVNAFVVVVAGGMGNLRGAALIAIVLGEIQAIGSIWFRPVGVQVFAIGLVIVILIVRSRARPAYLFRAASPDVETAAPRVIGQIGLVLAVGLALAPLVVGGALPQQATGVLPYALVAVAIGVLLRFGGVLNIGMGAAFGASAYAVVVLSRQTAPPPGVVLLGCGVVAALLVSLAFALYASVASGVEYMMLTFLTTIAASKAPILLPVLAGGANGLQLQDVRGAGFGMDPLNGPGFYLVALALATLVFGVVWFITSSGAGRVAEAAGRNPLRVASVGYRLANLRLMVALLAGLLAGLAGWIYSIQARIVGQDVLGLDVSLNGLTYALVGGIQFPILGPLLGAVGLRALGGLQASASTSAGLYAGVGLLLVVYFLPDGIPGLVRRGVTLRILEPRSAHAACQGKTSPRTPPRRSS